MICGELVDDGTGWMQWRYHIYVDGEFITRSKPYDTRFFAKRGLRRAVRRYGKAKPYKYCKPIPKPNAPKGNTP